MKVLVIGSSGQLARSLVQEASNKEMELEAVGRTEIDLERSDIVARLEAMEKPDIVINAAAYTAVDKAESEPELAHGINSDGVEQVALFCERGAIPLVHVSTDYVFDGASDRPYKEADAVRPLGVYGRSKLEGERRVARACSRHIILRTAWVYSPFGGNFVKTMLRLAQTRDQINVVADQFGNPTYAPHLAQAILSLAPLILKTDPASQAWGVYHASATGEASWYDFACEIFKQSASYGRTEPQVLAIATKEYPTPAKRPANSRLDCGKLDKTFGIRLPDWRLGTAECVGRLFKEEQ